MEQNQILFFLKVSELEHMTRAAEELNVSQPYLSNSIAELETELGVKLFDRVGRGIRLNQFGKIVYQYGNQILGSQRDMLREINEAKQANQKQLRISTSTSMYIPALMARVQKQLPDLNVHLHTAKATTIYRELAKGDIDLAIMGPKVSTAFSSELLIAERGIVVYPPDHWLKSHEEVSIHDLKNEVFISTGEGYAMADLLKSVYPDEIQKLKSNITTTDTNSALQFVKAGVGIAIAPRSLLKIDPYFLGFHSRLKMPCLGTVYLAWRKSQYLDATTKQFMTIAKDFFSNLSKI